MKNNNDTFYFAKSNSNKVGNPKFDKFLKIGATAVLAISLIGGATYKAYDNHVNDKVKEAEALIVKMGNPTLTQLKNMGFRNNDLYSKNKTMLENLEKDQKLLKAMKVPVDIPTLKNENENRFKKSEAQLKQDLSSTEKIVALGKSNPTEEQKREILYHNTQDFENFKGASSNNLVNQQGLANINANLQKQSTFLKEAKAEILKSVKDKLNNGDFNFVNKKKEYQMKLLENLHQERNELSSIKSEIEKDSDLRSEIKPQEITASEKAINDIETIAEEQILQDEKFVNEMVKTLAEKGIKLDDSQLAQSNSEASTAVNNSSGFNFMHYYLLSQWMSSSSKPSVTNNFTNQYNSGHTPAIGSMLSQQGPSYNGSMKTGLVNNNPYDFREPGSHLNQTLAAKGINTHNSMNFHQIQQKIMNVKTKISSYRSARIARSSVSIRGSSGG